MIVLYTPRLEDLWFREKFMGDPATMSYNAAWGGTIPFPKDAWAAWYGKWVEHGDETRRYYRYLLEEESGAFVGEVAYHWDADRNIFLADVIVAAEHRGRGFGKAGLALLCRAAKENGVAVLYDDLAADNPARKLFLDMGFTVDSVSDEAVTLKKVL